MAEEFKTWPDIIPEALTSKVSDTKINTEGPSTTAKEIWWEVCKYWQYFAIIAMWIITNWDSVAEARSSRTTLWSYWYTDIKGEVDAEQAKTDNYSNSKYNLEIEYWIDEYLLDPNKDNYDFIISSIQQLNQDELEWFLSLYRSKQHLEQNSKKRNLFKKIIVWARKFKSNFTSNKKLSEWNETLNLPLFKIVWLLSGKLAIRDNITNWNHKKELFLQDYKLTKSDNPEYNYKIYLKFNDWDKDYARYQTLYVRIEWWRIYTNVSSFGSSLKKFFPNPKKDISENILDLNSQVWYTETTEYKDWKKIKRLKMNQPFKEIKLWKNNSVTFLFQQAK
jgi:hypothetical protein